PRCLCIDEVYVSKYLQTEYACVLLDFDTGAIYDLIPSRRKEELSSYLIWSRGAAEACINMSWGITLHTL
ncbi:MAG: hypothetical protein U0N94_05880, partial [Clostridia bacterium]